MLRILDEDLMEDCGVEAIGEHFCDYDKGAHDVEIDGIQEVTYLDGT